MTELQLIEKHEQILNYLLKYREEDNSFIFSPRKQHNDLENNHLNCRLCKGYWFQGASHYIFVPLYRRGCKANKTKTIGYVQTNDNQYIEIVYKQLDGITTEEYKLYQELIDFLKQAPQIREVKNKRERQYFCYLVSNDLKENLDFFVKVLRKKADELILKYNLEDKYFIDENSFNAQIDEIRKIKKKQVVITIEDFEQRYSNFVNSLPLYGSVNYAKLYTKSQNKPFKVYKNSQNSIVVYAFTENATSMVITLNQLKKVFFEKENYLYASYEQVLIDRILDEKLIDKSELIGDNEMKYNQSFMKTKNIILYGSPGVGKTHNVNKLISMIENGKLEKDAFTAIQENLNETVFLDNDLKKRVKFITFHQSFGYEDFIEGFRPDEKGDIQLEDGIFKTIVDDASSNKKVVSNEHITFDEAYDIFRADFIDESLDILKTVTEKDIEICDFQDKFIKVKTKGAKNEHYVKKSDLDIVVDAFFNNIIQRPADIKKLEVKKDTIALAGYYFPIASKIVDIIKNNKVDIENEKNFYLVIDEINRGNISKIFGELITLIEESKRDKLEIQLPYSKKPFSVPSNLYILGTMNSTDKSIALIDIALRRRFTFLKMKPSLELVPSFAQDIFTKINNQIVEDLGEDYLIGHSYFMNIDESELEFVLDFKIIPLLEEYYYGNNEGFEKVKNMIKGM